MKNFLPSRSVTLYRLEALQKENSSLFIDLLGCRDNNWSNDESNEKIVTMYGKKLNFDDLWVVHGRIGLETSYEWKNFQFSCLKCTQMEREIYHRNYFDRF